MASGGGDSDIKVFYFGKATSSPFDIKKMDEEERHSGILTP